jgi:hypothetical protein
MDELAASAAAGVEINFSKLLRLGGAGEVLESVFSQTQSSDVLRKELLEEVRCTKATIKAAKDRVLLSVIEEHEPELWRSLVKEILPWV